MIGFYGTLLITYSLHDARPGSVCHTLLVIDSICIQFKVRPGQVFKLTWWQYDRIWDNGENRTRMSFFNNIISHNIGQETVNLHNLNRNFLGSLCERHVLQYIGTPCPHTQTHRQTYMNAHTHTPTQLHTQTENDTHTQAHTIKQREKDTNTHTHPHAKHWC